MSRTPLFRHLRRRMDQTMGDGLWHQPISRRRFLQVAGAGLAWMALQPFSVQSAYSDPAQPVLIVGGGTAGLVTAYRLMRQGVPCEIYEASGRLGGRMYTRPNFNADGMFCELGGELVDTGHTALIELCGELGLALESFLPGDEGLEETLYDFSGRVFREPDVMSAFEPLAARMADDLRRIFPDGEIIIPTYRNPMSAQWLDDMSLDAYLRDRGDGVARWLIELIRVAYTGEYGLEPHQQSALNLLLLIRLETDDGFAVYGDSDEAWRIAGGSSRLPQALVRQTSSQVPVHLRHELVAIQPDGDDLSLTFRHGDRLVERSADQVVLALPFSVLRRVSGILDLPLNTVKKRAIRELGYGTNAKQMVGFTRRFWRDPDGPLPAATGSIFTDRPSQAFWETSRLQPGESGILSNFLGGRAGARTRPDQWHRVLDDLRALYASAGDYFDGNMAHFNWSRHPWARGSYACPRPGQYTQLMGSAHEPELEGRLLFAGEHCSVDWLGYMNGAVESGELAARQVAAIRQASLKSQLLVTQVT